MRLELDSGSILYWIQIKENESAEQFSFLPIPSAVYPRRQLRKMHIFFIIQRTDISSSCPSPFQKHSKHRFQKHLP
jgi:hypothetical protein